MQLRIGRHYLALIPALSVALAVGLSLSGCAGLPTLLPTPTQLAGAGDYPDGVDANSLACGRALVVTQCTGCHRFFWPHEYAPQQWPAIMSNMGQRAFLSRRRIGDMTRYMVAASRATRCESEPPQPELALPAADAATLLRGQSLARVHCAQCHRLRQPQEFAAAVWPRIIRQHARLVSISEDELRDVARYYVESARQGR